MKNLIKSIFLMLIVIAFVSCDSEADNFMGDASEGGASVKIDESSSGKVLGEPSDYSDLPNATLTVTDNVLDLTVHLQFGGSDVAKYEIVKSYKKESEELPEAETVVATGTNLSLNVTYASMTDYLDNTSVSNISSLRIGDQFIFRTKIYTNSGEVYYARAGRYTVTIGCGSNIAGAYVMHFTSGDTFITVTEIGPGKYRSNYLPPFSSTYWFEFSDLCGDLIITDWQYQSGNPITPLDEVVGYIDSVTGDLVFEGINVDGVSWYVNRDFTILKL